MSRQTKRCIKFGSFVLLILYIAVLIYVCFLSEDYGRDVVTSYYRYNFIPFKEIRRFYIYRDVVGIRAFLANLFGNVLAFMPFGFFMPILRLRLRKWYCMLGMTFLLSLMIEITQLLTRVGSFDVDDLILNTSGGILGYLLFYIINKVRRKWKTKDIRGYLLKRGIYASAFGIASLICMAVLTIASFVKAGNLPAFVGGIGYLSFLAAVFGLWLSVQLRKDNEAYGTMVHGAFYINLTSVMIHGLIFLAGCLSIIM